MVGLSHARTILAERFGYPDFRPGQSELIAAALGGRDALGVLPTGGGKSLCYQIPALALDRPVLVLSPLVSLMEDQARRADEAGIPAGVLNATRSASERERTLERARCGALRLLFVAPERLETEAFAAALPELRPGLVAVDEAHCISEWGHDFRPAYRRIAKLRGSVRAPFLALTATATPRVRDDIARVLELKEPARVVQSFDRPNLSWAVHRVRGHRDRVRAIRRLVLDERGAALVYAGTRGGTERIRIQLARAGVRAAVYHAGLDGEVRAGVQDDFLADRVRVVVATNAFGMGVDKPDVRLVVHARLSATLESYYQEAGRAGRDGEPARCLALYHPDDQALPRGFIDESRPSLRELVPAAWRLRRTLSGTTTPMALSELRTLVGAPELRKARSLLVALERIGVVEVAPGPSDPWGRVRTADLELADEVTVRLRREPGRAAWRGALALRRAALRSLRAVRGYAKTRRCRRAYVLRYFGEPAAARCAGCDRCDRRMASVRRTVPSG